MKSGNGTRGKVVSKRGFPLTLWLIGAAVVVLATVGVFMALGRDPDLPGEYFASQGQEHLASEEAALTEYNSDPPTSGPHSADVARWGTYDYTVRDEILVHNLEDGGVVLWYPMGTLEENEAFIERLEEVARPYEKIVIAPRYDLETTYALSAWQYLDKFNEFDADRITEFLEAFADRPHY